jgi:hypothetical protein
MNESLEKQAQRDEKHEDCEVVERSHFVHCAYVCIWLIDSTNFFLSIFFWYIYNSSIRSSWCMVTETM